MSRSYKTLWASVFLILLHVISVPAVAPRALATQNKSDVIVLTKPHFRNKEMHGMEIASDQGRIGNQWFVYLDFKVGRKTYSAWWSSHTFGAPVYLAGDVRYKFLIRLEHNSSECKVVTIWHGKKLIWKNPELKKGNG